MIKLIIVTAYFLIGVFFMGMLPDSSGRPYGLMCVLWPIIVSILAVMKIFNIVFCIGEKIGEKFR